MLNKTQLESIFKYEATLDGQRRAIAHIIDQVVQIQGHCECPLCDRPFTEAERSSMNELYDLAFETLKKIDAQIEQQRIVDEPRLAAERVKRETERNKFKADVDEYIVSHDKVFAKIVRDWRKTGVVTLPGIEWDHEKKVWNVAIEKWADKTTSRNDVSDNIDDFKFDV